MRNSSTSILRKVLTGLLIPLVAAVFMVLPRPAAALYPSDPVSVEADRKVPNTRRNLEELSKKYPQLIQAETSDLNAEFVKYDLSNFDLRDADLRGAYFSVTNAENANFSGANLDDVIAYATRFDNANLSDVTLRNADLLKSFFKGANIDGADFTDANLDQSQQRDLCSRATGKNSRTGASTFDSLGCGSVSDRYQAAY